MRPGSGAELPPPQYVTLKEFRVAVWNDANSYPLDSSHAAAIDALVEDLLRSGVAVDVTARLAANRLSQIVSFSEPSALIRLWSNLAAR